MMIQQNNNITVHDIECKIQERIELLEENDERECLAELRLLLDWIICGDEY